MGRKFSDSAEEGKSAAAFFLKKLKSLKVNPEHLELFYHTITESIVTYNSLCFHSESHEDQQSQVLQSNRDCHSKLIGSVVQAHFERKARHRSRAILADPTNPLNEDLTAQTSARVTSGRLVSLKTRTNRLFRSFLPSAIRLNATELGVHNL